MRYWSLASFASSLRVPSLSITCGAIHCLHEAIKVTFALTKKEVITEEQARQARVAQLVRNKALHADWDGFTKEGVNDTVKITKALIEAHPKQGPLMSPQSPIKPKSNRAEFPGQRAVIVCTSHYPPFCVPSPTLECAVA